MAETKRKIRQGVVIRAKQSKTVIIAVQRWYKHPLYGKAMRRSKKYHVHDSAQRCKLGDLVKIEETRPLSRLKRWRVVEILEHRDVPEVTPLELDEQAQQVQEEETIVQPESQAQEMQPEEAVAEQAEETEQPTKTTTRRRRAAPKAETAEQKPTDQTDEAERPTRTTTRRRRAAPKAETAEQKPTDQTD